MTNANPFRPVWTKDFPTTIPEGSFAVTTYTVERLYGGPEEGGWWYDWYTPIRVELCPDEADADTRRLGRMVVDGSATKEMCEEYYAHNDACLEQAERMGVDPDSIGSLDGRGRQITTVEGADEYLGQVLTEHPHYC